MLLSGLPQSKELPFAVVPLVTVDPVEKDALSCIDLLSVFRAKPRASTTAAARTITRLITVFHPDPVLLVPQLQIHPGPHGDVSCS
jgi:hypothetical protein